MTISSKRPSLILAGTLGSVLLILAGCDEPLDIDLRGGKALNTSAAAEHATAERPKPDARGIISYPGYQVAVARRGDTVASVANRIGVSPNELATYNGLTPDNTLNDGEVLALRTRVPESGSGPIRPSKPVDIASVAGPAIDDAKTKSIQTTKLEPAAKATPAAKPAVTAKAAAQEASKQQPERHKVKSGETAYSISRLYNVPIDSLAEWNGLDSKYTIREGQLLLIPVALKPGQKPPTRKVVTAPGQGSPTPLPPSAAQPLPKEDLKPTAETEAKVAAKPTSAPDLSKSQTKASSSGKMAYPVNGDIVREYSKGRNDGIDIAAPAGTAVVVADAGTVAAVTEDTNGVPIVVVKHTGDLLTIYSNVDKVSVKKGSKVSRGQKIAVMRPDNTALHFEIRKGFDSVDPVPYLN